ncbi:hypothetical protein N7509_004731 [Penicillium cosmopolitanum]|uniref:DUF8213 domain-containing protein n=1 Tax=Penicillium cosmopolitanum TaxID=1131564 RepID=A0A9X0B9D3_9EURO|nr:uncharacterized protein N7509_004731 [Penicillium cosmopolitanum]KAJ5396618.1 hypothetical protein N7509_004731 [Penicillium cosmopolitanum]
MMFGLHAAANLLGFLPHLYATVLAEPGQKQFPEISKRSVVCLKVGNTAVATWTNSAGQTCSFTGLVGSNYGINTVNEGDYSCNGRCGAGCSGAAVGNAYTQDCFSHDICSYFENASGASQDPNCGAAYDAAIDDTLFGVTSGCSQENPTEQIKKPATSPICQ